jgi:hypothetical protein
MITMAEVVKIRGEVIDAGSSTTTPTARRVELYAVEGRGLSQVVRGCADEWGYERTPVGEGKTWFVVRGATRAAGAAQSASIAEPRLPEPARDGDPVVSASGASSSSSC